MTSNHPVKAQTVFFHEICTFLKAIFPNFKHALMWSSPLQYVHFFFRGFPWLLPKRSSYVCLLPVDVRFLLLLKVFSFALRPSIQCFPQFYLGERSLSILYHSVWTVDLVRFVEPLNLHVCGQAINDAVNCDLCIKVGLKSISSCVILPFVMSQASFQSPSTSCLIFVPDFKKLYNMPIFIMQDLFRFLIFSSV